MDYDQPPVWENSMMALFTAARSLALSDEELRSYPRWYSDLLARNGSGVVLVEDTVQFISKFGLTRTEDVNNIINTLGHAVNTLDPTQFFSILRLSSHVLQGHSLDYQHIFSPAPLLTPRSILSKKIDKNLSEDVNNGQPRLDFDSFASFILTGEVRHKASTNKRVKFSKEPPKVAAAAPLSMEDLMRQRAIQNQYGNKTVTVEVYEEEEEYDDDDDYDDEENSIKSSLPPPPVSFLMNMNAVSLGLSSGQLETLAQEEKDRTAAAQKSKSQYEDDEKEVITALEQSHFKNVSIDSVLHHGTSSFGPPPVSFGFHTPPGLDSGTPSPSPPLPSDTNNTMGYFNVNRPPNSPSPLHNSTTVSPSPMVNNNVSVTQAMSKQPDLFSQFESFTNSLRVPNGGNNNTSGAPSPAVNYSASPSPNYSASPVVPPSLSPQVSFEIRSDHSAPTRPSSTPIMPPTNAGSSMTSLNSNNNIPSIRVSSLNDPPSTYQSALPPFDNIHASISMPSTPTINSSGFYSSPSTSTSTRRAPPPPAPPSRQGTTPLTPSITGKAPPPPPPSRRKTLPQQQSQSMPDRGFNTSPFYTNVNGSGNINVNGVNSALAASSHNLAMDPVPDLLADLKALQAEVDRISQMG